MKWTPGAGTRLAEELRYTRARRNGHTTLEAPPEPFI